MDSALQMLSLFASVIAPFGGFFASGFKRGFKIKDFGDSIPGHGGMTDRMDCQVSLNLTRVAPNGMCVLHGEVVQRPGSLMAPRSGAPTALPAFWSTIVRAPCPRRLRDVLKSDAAYRCC